MTMRIREERRGLDLEGKNMNSYVALLEQTFGNTGLNKQHHPEEESSSIKKKRFSSYCGSMERRYRVIQ